MKAKPNLKGCSAKKEEEGEGICTIIILCRVFIGFGGLEVVCWPLVPKCAGSHPAEAIGSLGRKNPQDASLRRGSKAVGLMS